MTPNLRFAAWLATVVAIIVAAMAGAWLLLVSGLAEAERRVFDAALDARVPVLLFSGFLAVVAVGGGLGWLFRRYVTSIRALAEETRIVLSANPDHRVVAAGTPELEQLAGAINRLGDHLRARSEDLQARVSEAGSRLEEERNRLAALMSELSQAVLVCNAEGRILLYNEQARRMFERPAASGAGVAIVGLGRSVFALLDRDQVAHALDKIQQGLDAEVERPVTRFLTTATNGVLARVQLAPFLSGARRIAGMVLLLEDVTEFYAEESQRRSLLQALATRVRQPAANIRTAAENLVTDPAMPAVDRARFVHIIAEESRGLSASLDAALTAYGDALQAGIELEDMAVSELVRVARRQLESALGLPIAIGPVADDAWVRIDSYAIVQVLAALAGHLSEAHQASEVELRATASGGFVQVDLVWSGDALANGALAGWEERPLHHGGEQHSLVTPRDVLERHGGELWRQADATPGRSCYRMLLPATRQPAPSVARRPATDSRPEYYDFDLFRYTGAAGELAERPLAELAYTVFDTETTGLEPSAGDEIISIGAVRIVNGRLLKHEIYEQMVNPRRSIPRASVRIHGIKSRDLSDQPAIAEVLPVFHRFCEETVLVAHNAAFDMRFFELKETETGVRFSQPVLDTLLLSVVANPSLENHQLEAIADRLGLRVIGRHTALGDALLTGEIFLKLLPLLAERGIVNLRQALEAARETYYARLQY